MNVAILGGGQLGRMLAAAGARLGVRCRVLDPAVDACAGPGFGGCAEHVCGLWDDAAALDRLALGASAATLEFENVPVSCARSLASRVRLDPGPEALAVCQDRLREKSLLTELGVPVPPFAAVDTRPQLDEALRRVGTPAVLKTRSGGYDGKGQALIADASAAESAWQSLGAGRAPLIVEAMVPFARELSIIAVRGRAHAGHAAPVVFYPLVENEHRGGVLRVSRAPAPDSATLQPIAERYARAVLERLDYVGVLTIELFEVAGHPAFGQSGPGPTLLANEMAPRVHNSGHWTLDAPVTSQFENHLRAVLGWPLGDTGASPTPAAAPASGAGDAAHGAPGGGGIGHSGPGHAGMVNILGAPPHVDELLAIPGARLHLYGKSPRPGRKLGHVNVWSPSAGQRDALVEAVSACLAD